MRDAPRVIDFDNPGPCEAYRGNVYCGEPAAGWTREGYVFCRDHMRQFEELAAILLDAATLNVPTPTRAEAPRP